VYAKLVKLALDLKHRGHRKLGIKMLYEVVRWQHYMETTDRASDFKLNNNYTAQYARMIMARNPALDGIFETREDA
jgi:hypothetical protein